VRAAPEMGKLDHRRRAMLAAFVGQPRQPGHDLVPVGMQIAEGGGLAPEMSRAFLVSTIAFFLLYGLLLAIRYRSARIEDRTDAVVERLGTEGGWR